MIRKCLQKTALMSLLIALSSPLYAATYYVSASNGNSSYDGLAAVFDGTHGPKATIQTGIDTTVPGDVVIVAQGSYEEQINFNGKDITVQSTDPEDDTVIAATIINGGGSWEVEATTVTFSSSETSAAVLTGFTITSSVGEGIHITSSSPSISRNVIRNNSGMMTGGGIYCNGGSPVIADNTIRNNGGEGGGGVYLRDGTAILRRNIIHNNGGMSIGGVFCYGGSPQIENNVIYSNSSGMGGGGGIYCYNSSPQIINNTIVFNEGGDDYGNYSGGGIYCGGSSSPTVKNCILWGNTIGWGSTLNQITVNSGSPTVTYCDVQGGWSGTGNLDVDPLFADSANSDYHLKSEIGRWDGTQFVSDTATSPCINTGDPASEFENELLPNGGRANMGAYGNTAEASMGYGYFLIVSPEYLNIAEGTSGTFNVSLDTLPDSAVTVTITKSSGSDDITVTDGASLVFDAGNGTVPQSVTVSVAQNDDNAVDNQATLAIHTPGVGLQYVTVTEVDDDYLLTLSSGGNGTVSPAGDTVCVAGTVLPIEAVPDTHYHFVNWTGDVTNVADTISPSTTVTMQTDDAAITGNFAIDRHTVTTITDHGSVTGGGTYDYGTTIQLQAYPDTHWHFSYWEGDASGTANPVSITVTGDMTVTAVMERTLPQIQVSVSALDVPEGGTATFGVALAHPLWPGEQATVNVSLIAGDPDLSLVGPTSLVFTEFDWSTSQTVMVAAAEDDADAETGTAGILLSSADFSIADVNVSLSENENEALLEVSADGPGTVTPNGSALYPRYTIVNLSAVPDSGKVFYGWEGDTSDIDDPSAPQSTITLNGNAVISANFGDIVGAVTIVNTMPSRYVRPDVSIPVWGNVNHGKGTIAPMATYEWTFTPESGVTVNVDTSELAGSISDVRNICLDASFTLNGVTSASVQATLACSDTINQHTSTTVIEVIASDDPKSDTPLESQEIERKIAIEEGLYWLYLAQSSDGRWSDTSYYYDDAPSLTATAVWSFENMGHTPAADPALDIYRETVIDGLEAIFALSVYHGISETSRGNPDADGNGLGVQLGGNGMYDGYSRGMCMAALGASDTPDQVTYVSPFDNGGLGTTYLRIMQDAADFNVWCLGNNSSGGWGYSYGDNDWADTSIASWNYVGLEAAAQLGATVPDWVPTWCENFLQQTYAGGAFGYSSSYEGSPANSGSGLTGLTYVSLNARIPGLDVGAMKLENLRHFAQNWRGSGYYSNHGDGYQMWTVARGMRMANATHLNSSTGEYDWQRNITSSGDAREGFWPYLIGSQSTDGSWNMSYGYTFSTAWAVLCLSEGVVGKKDIIHDVEIVSIVPNNADLEILTDTFVGEIPEITDTGDSWILRWFLGDIASGSVVDLSYDQYIRDTAPGETRRIQDSVTMTYTSGDSLPMEFVYGALDVAVRSSLYTIDVESLSSTYETGMTGQFTVTVGVPSGQKFQRLAAPQTGSYVLEPDLDGSGASWTILTYDLLNSQAFDSDDTPVSIRLRSAPTQAGLAAAVFCEPITVSGDPIPCDPGRFLEVEVTLTANEQGTAPQVDSISVFYNTASARVVLDVLDVCDESIATVAEFALFPSDYGSTVTQTRNWPLTHIEPGAYQIRASVIENGVSLDSAVDDFTVTTGAGTGSVSTTIATDLPMYCPNEDVTIISKVFNNDPNTSFRDVPVTVEITDASSASVPNGGFAYTIPILASAGHDTRQFVWNSASTAPGDYTVTQTTSPSGLDRLTAVTVFEIAGSSLSDGSLSGTVTAAPRIVAKPETFDVSWSISNSGNIELTDLQATQKIVMTTDPTAPTSVLTAYTVDISLLAPRQTIPGIWSVIPSVDLPTGDHLILLEVASASEASHVLAVSGVTITAASTTDNTPPVTTDDYASDGVWANLDALITLTATDEAGGSGVATTVYSLDGVEYTGATVSVTGETDLDGVAVLYHSVDVAGNIEADHSISVLIDKTAPEITSIVAPAPNANGWNDSAVTVSFTATDALSGVATVTDPVVVTTEGAGQSVTGTAADLAGNAAVTTATVNIDKTAPIITVTGVSDGDLTNQDVTPVISITEANLESSTVTLDGQPFTSGTPVTDEGVHTLVVTAMDLAGHTATTTITFTIDTTAPVLTATLDPVPNAAGWNHTDTTVTFAATDAGSAIVDLTAPVTVTAEGADQAVTGTATDAAGNTGSLTVTVSLDRTAPVITSTVSPAPNANGWNDNDVTVTFAATDTLSGVVTVTDPVVVTTEGAGQTVTGTAADLAGNTAATTATVNIDKTSPVITVTGVSDGELTNQDVTPVITVNEVNPATTTVTLDGQPFTSVTPVTDEGVHTLVVTAMDLAGHTATTSLTFTIDKTAPVITHDYTGGTGWQGTPITVTPTVTDALTGVEEWSWTLDGNPAVTGVPTIDITTTGEHTVGISATDGAGNTAAISFPVNIDLIPPTVSHDFTSNGVWINTVPTISFSGWDAGGSGLLATWYHVDGGARTDGNSVTINTPGTHTVVLGATDGALNNGTVTLSVKLDTTPPVTVDDYAFDDIWTNADALISLTATDDLSGVASTTYTIDGVETEGAQISLTTEDITVVTYRSTDNAGNVESDKTVTVKLDKTDPEVSNMIPPDGSVSVAGETAISANVMDLLSGIDPATITMTVNGVSVAVTYDSAGGVVTHTPSEPLPEGPIVVVLTLSDVAGNETQAQWSYAVSQTQSSEYTIFADGSDQKLKLVGGHHEVYGRIHSNDEVQIGGGFNTVHGTVSACGDVKVRGAKTEVDEVVRNAPADVLPYYDFVAIQARADYTHAADLLVDAPADLPNGIHYVIGDVTIAATLTANVTIIATGSITVSGASCRLSARDTTHILFFAQGNIHIAGSGNTLSGILYSPNGGSHESGGHNTFINGAIYAGTVSITGGHTVFGTPGE